MHEKAHFHVFENITKIYYQNKFGKYGFFAPNLLHKFALNQPKHCLQPNTRLFDYQILFRSMNTPGTLFPKEENPDHLNIEGEQSEGTPPAVIPKPRGNQFPKTDNPKSEQFTGRATKDEADIINTVLRARKQEGQPYDIVRLALDMIKHIEADWLQSFKTK